MHTLWLREHNRVANALFAKFGASKSSEFYFQEARRIVIAELQHITYAEYLPVILGIVKFENYILNVKNSKNAVDSGLKALFVGAYNDKSDPAVFNEFSAAAFRMGHSQLRSFIR